MASRDPSLTDPAQLGPSRRLSSAVAATARPDTRLGSAVERLRRRPRTLRISKEHSIFKRPINLRNEYCLELRGPAGPIGYREYGVPEGKDGRLVGGNLSIIQSDRTILVVD